MYDVTDTAFRQIITRCGKPDVFFTEFVSVDGLVHPASRAKLIKRHLRFEEIERPIVAQLWGRDPEKFRIAAQVIHELGFDGIDINMGCPVRKEVKSGCCAALILEPQRAQEIIRATQESAGGLPVSVKTRIGFDKNVIDSWM